MGTLLTDPFKNRAPGWFSTLSFSLFVHFKLALSSMTNCYLFNLLITGYYWVIFNTSSWKPNHIWSNYVWGVGVWMNWNELNVYYESITPLIIKFPCYRVGPEVHPSAQPLLISASRRNAAVIHVNFSTIKLSVAAVLLVSAWLMRLRWLVNAGKMGGVRNLAQGNIQRRSVFMMLCAGDLLSIIMQQKARHNCWIKRFNCFGMSWSLLAARQQTFIIA